MNPSSTSTRGSAAAACVWAWGSLRFLLVQDLPGMVEGVPGGAAGDEPGRAPRAGKLSGRAGAAGPDSFDGGHVLRREGPLPEPEHARVENLGFPHVRHDLVAIPATAARAFAQHGRATAAVCSNRSHAATTFWHPANTGASPRSSPCAAVCCEFTGYRCSPVIGVFLGLAGASGGLWVYSESVLCAGQSIRARPKHLPGDGEKKGSLVRVNF